MNIGIFLGHPAHFHYFKNVAHQLKENGHRVYFAVKEKDILEKLLQDSEESYIKVRNGRGNSWVSMAMSIIKMDKNIVKMIFKYNIDVMVGVPPAFGTRVICRKPVIACGEDDFPVIPFFSVILQPFNSVFVAPSTCYTNKSSHSIYFPGYMELGYLHPNYFAPSIEFVEKYSINLSSPYFIIRFSALNAFHDKGIKGINKEIAQRLVDILKPHGQIYITSERPLEPEFEPYRIKINPLDMHHVMAFASLYIGDSQTMAAEAGVLGVPFVRFNDFVGRIGYLDELEEKQSKQYVDYLNLDHHYDLGVGIRASEEGSVERLCQTVERLASMPSEERKRIYSERRQRMLADKIDYAKFLTWFIENYPQSVDQAKKADEKFWSQFK